MKIKEFIKSQLENVAAFVKYRCERFTVWALERVLQNQAIVIAFAFKDAIEIRDQFQREVKYVAADHWKHLNALDARLKALESRESQ